MAKKKAKVDKVAIAQEITELQSWVDRASEELEQYGDSRFRIDIGQPTGNFRSFSISPNAMPEATQNRIDKYLKRVIREEITASRKKIDALVASMAK